MAYAIENDLLGQQKIGTVDTVQNFQLGTIVAAVDPVYGGGEFVYLLASGTVALGNVVQYDQYNATAVVWAGTVGSGRALAVAMAAHTTGTYGWFQISGAAVVSTTGTITTGAPVYYGGTAGVLQSATRAGTQVLSAQSVTANGVPAANQAVVQMSRAHAQGQIT